MRYNELNYILVEIPFNPFWSSRAVTIFCPHSPAITHTHHHPTRLGPPCVPPSTRLGEIRHTDHLQSRVLGFYPWPRFFNPATLQLHRRAPRCLEPSHAPPSLPHCLCVRLDVARPGEMALGAGVRGNLACGGNAPQSRNLLQIPFLGPHPLPSNRVVYLGQVTLKMDDRCWTTTERNCPKQDQIRATKFA